MPIENEIKQVLCVSSDFESFIKKQCDSRYEIKQAYLQSKSKITTRLRKMWVAEEAPHYYLQNKIKGKGGRIVEIATNISESDFEFLWKVAKGKLRKTRCTIQTETTKKFKTENGKDWTECWEIDFFKDSEKKTYFCLAECELPDGLKSPLFEVPKVIRENTIFVVPKGDSRFSNSRLGDIEYATSIYGNLLMKEKVKNNAKQH